MIPYSSNGITVVFRVPFIAPGLYSVVVTNEDGKESNAWPFVIETPKAAAPVVTSINPVSGFAGSYATVYGLGFTSDSNSVYMTKDGIKLNVVSNILSTNGDRIAIRIPTSFNPGIYTVSVENNNGASNNTVLFEVRAPVVDPIAYVSVSSLYSPEVWEMGSEHTINWTSLAVNNVNVKLYQNGVEFQTLATNITNYGTYTITVPNTVTVGNHYAIRVIDSLTGTYGQTVSYFMLPSPIAPVIQSIDPIAGSVGTIVTVTGTGFTTDTANTISFGTGSSFFSEYKISTDGRTLSYIIPSVLPGTYLIYVGNRNGQSQAMYFRVTQDPVFAPTVSYITPNPVQTASQITFAGKDFTPSNNTATFTSGSTVIPVADLQSTNSGSNISLTLPATIIAGTYAVTVTTVNGVSSPVQLVVTSPTVPPVVPAAVGFSGTGGGGALAPAGTGATKLEVFPVKPTIVVFNQAIVETAPNTALVTWNTNLPTTGKIIFDTVSHSNNLGAYTSRSTTVFGTTTTHAIALYGLKTGVTYFARPVSDHTASGATGVGEEISIRISGKATPKIDVLTTASSTSPVDKTVVGESCDYLGEYLKSGVMNTVGEVVKLQKFLNDVEKIQVQITGKFDSATITAVKVFQSRYASDVLTPWGLSEPTGYVYVTTRAKINQIRCNQGGIKADASLVLAEAKSVVNDIVSRELPVVSKTTSMFVPVEQSVPTIKTIQVQRATVPTSVAPTLQERAQADLVSVANQQKVGTTTLTAEEELSALRKSKESQLSVAVLAIPTFIYKSINKVFDFLK